MSDTVRHQKHGPPAFNIAVAGRTRMVGRSDPLEMAGAKAIDGNYRVITLFSPW